MAKLIRCPNCGREFQPKRDWQRFHSEECRKSYHREEAREALRLLRERERDGS